MEKYLQCKLSRRCGKLYHLTRLQFVEYDQRAHKLSPLVQFSFWVQSMYSLDSFCLDASLQYCRFTPMAIT